jgi:hypothetical protein
MAKHRLVEGIEEIGKRYREKRDRSGLFDEMYDLIHEIWLCRKPGRWPSESNWLLRVTEQVTFNASATKEKQLQKAIAKGLKSKGWGNDMPIASGLVDSNLRHMQVDLTHHDEEELPDGIELFELKLTHKTPYDAAVQILGYGAIYRLYRSEKKLLEQFRGNKVICAKRVALKVLAPHGYYANSRGVDLQKLEKQLDRQVRDFAEHLGDQLEMSFEFMAFPVGFDYQPGMDPDAIYEAVRSRGRRFPS